MGLPFCLQVQLVLAFPMMFFLFFFFFLEKEKKLYTVVLSLIRIVVVLWEKSETDTSIY